MFRSISVVTCLVFFCSLSPALARCEAVIVLQRMHDAYLATLTETGQMQLSGARSLLVYAGGSPKSLIQQLKKADIQIEEDRLTRVIQQAVDVAQIVMTGAPLPTDTFQHSQNIKWLGNIAHRTNCKDFVVAADWSGRHSRASSSPPPKYTLSKLKSNYPIVIAGVLVLLALAGLGIRKYRKSRLFLVRQMDRLPRSPASMTLPATFTDAEGNIQQTTVTALDISTGGMKFDWPDAPPPGIVLTVSLPFGQRLARVAWSNAYFAGIVFDSPLSKREMAQLLEESPQESKTAPEGAASSA